MSYRHLLRQVITSFFILLFTFLLLPKPKTFALAEELAPDAPLSLQKYMGGNEGFLDAIAEAGYCRLAGCPDAKIVGIIPYETNYLAMMMTDRPASTSRYLAHLMDNIGLPTPPTVHAQGTGYRLFTPVIKLWQVFRDLTYTIYILIFVVIGFMIMFRTKINAQTVITIQSALPNLIITLLLITFSYAIAGFLIDIMYFTIYFLVYLAGSNHLIDAQLTMSYFLKHNLVGIFFPLGQADVVMNNISTAVGNFLFTLVGKAHSTGAVGSWFIKLFIAFSIFLQLAKLLMGLLKSYLMVIIQIITAPLQLLPNAIPGSKAFSNWLRTTASYLAPFPIITALFLLAIIFAVPGTQDNPFGVTQNLFSHDRLGTFPYISGVSTTAQDIASLVALAIILISPAAVRMAQDFFKVKESPYASEVASGLKSIGVPFQGISNWRQRHLQLARDRRMIDAMEKIGQNPQPKNT